MTQLWFKERNSHRISMIEKEQCEGSWLTCWFEIVDENDDTWISYRQHSRFPFAIRQAFKQFQLVRLTLKPIDLYFRIE